MVKSITIIKLTFIFLSFWTYLRVRNKATLYTCSIIFQITSYISYHSKDQINSTVYTKHMSVYYKFNWNSMFKEENSNCIGRKTRTWLGFQAYFYWYLLGLSPHIGRYWFQGSCGGGEQKKHPAHREEFTVVVSWYSYW